MLNARHILDALFPPICIACRSRIQSGTICEACYGGIAVHDALICGVCHACIDQVSGFIAPCHPDSLYILGGAADYGHPALSALVHHLKFKFMEDAADPLGDLLARYVAAMGLDFTGFTIVPVPLSRRRTRERGFNQAERIARRFASRTSIPLEPNILERPRYAKPQSDIANAAERCENVRGVFAVPERALASDILRNRPIILIDDVSTTGATFLEASTALKAAGAGTIVALAAAKT